MIAPVMLHPEPDQNRYGWFESTTFCAHPCERQKRIVNGWQVHPPGLRIADYLTAGGRVDLYRLTPINRLDPDEELQLTELLLAFEGSHYDMAGALFSGTRLFQSSRFFPGADLESLFCSEMITATLQRLNRMNHENPTRYNPAKLIRELLDQGTYQLVETYE